ncbi:Mitochonrial uncharacterized protein [Echinococcus granulosus]|uniref:Protein tumorous imaginal discs n=1 Tax=Echinococcus granulosus TaxID=6210 RepID=A0A068WIC0_ECHGR|nr:Mitochonrial uncharacterized protein [Echinococcus granulosus]CDS17351.1 protein tumorous imaginal discs [Echinococcus granulosus]
MALFRTAGKFVKLYSDSFKLTRSIHVSTQMLVKDYYKILGVSKGASQSDIKKAYYQLAKKYHPDINKSDKSAAQKFAEVSEAYEVLGDEEKRRSYDSFGGTSPGGFSGSASSFENFTSHFDPEELFRRIFRDSDFAYQEWSSGDRNFAESIFGFNTTREVVVNLSFEDAAKGVTREIVINVVVPCTTCEGSRCQPGTGMTTCPNCSGSGHETVSTGPFVLRSTCRRCSGSGSVVRYPCRACNGTGQTIGREQVKVAIPPGVEDGQVLRVSVGNGRNGARYKSSQELFVTVRVEASPNFRRDGADVHSNVTITLAQAALGGKIRIPGIYEQVLVTIPPGSSSHDRIRLPGKGISRVNGRGYGDHYVHLRISTPKQLSELQRALLLAFAETETNVKGSVDGVATTESALSRLHQTLTKLSSRDVGRSGNSATASGRYDDGDYNDDWISRVTSGAKRAFSAAKDFIGGGTKH